MHIGDMLSLCARGVEKEDYAETKCFSGFCAVLTGSACFGCVHRSYDLRWMFQVIFFCFLLVISAWSCLAVAFVLFNQSLLGVYFGMRTVTVTDYSSFS